MDSSGSEDQKEGFRGRDQTHSYTRSRHAPPYPNTTANVPRTSALTTAEMAIPGVAVTYSQDSCSDYLDSTLYPYARLNEQNRQHFSPWPHQHNWIPPTARSLATIQNYSEHVNPGFAPPGVMYRQPAAQSWIQCPVGNQPNENQELQTHAPCVNRQSAPPTPTQASTTEPSMNASSSNTDPVVQSRIQRLEEELHFCHDEWVIICIILALLRSSYYSVEKQLRLPMVPPPTPPQPLHPQSARVKIEENDKRGVRVLESRTSVPMSSSTLQRGDGRSTTPPPPELFATTIPDLTSEHFAPEYDFTAFKVSSFLTSSAPQPLPSTPRPSRSKGRPKGKKKQHPTARQEQSRSPSSSKDTDTQEDLSKAIQHDLEREMLMAFDDLMLQIRNLKTRIERVEEMIRHMTASYKRTHSPGDL